MTIRTHLTVNGPAILQSVRTGLERSEGTKDYLHLDGVGLVTLGSGSALVIDGTVLSVAELNQKLANAGITSPERQFKEEHRDKLVAITNLSSVPSKESALAKLRDEDPVIGQALGEPGRRQLLD